MVTKHLPWITLVIAILILLAFAGLSYAMLDHAMTLPQADQFRWDRMLVVYSAIQSLGFSAAGVLLGTTVQQSRVDDARKKSVEAEADANKARAARTIINGRLRAPGGEGDPQLVDQLRDVLA